MQELTMYAVVDSQGKIVKTVCYDGGKTRYWIFGSEDEAKEALKDELSTINEEIEIIKEEAKADGNKPEDYEDWDWLIKMKEYYEKCKIVPVKVILE